VRGFEPRAGLSYTSFCFFLSSQTLSRLRPRGDVFKRPRLSLLCYLHFMVHLPLLETVTLSRPLWLVKPPPLYRCGLAICTREQSPALITSYALVPLFPFDTTNIRQGFKALQIIRWKLWFLSTNGIDCTDERYAVPLVDESAWLL